MIALDTNSLSLLFVPGATVSMAGTTQAVFLAKERLEALVSRIADTHDKILIPTPVLSEMMVKMTLPQINLLLELLNKSAWFQVEAFDTAAAVELGTRTAAAIAAGDKREGIDAPWNKVRFDRQIVAIAKVAQATEIISDDSGVRSVGERWGIRVTSVADLPVPDEFKPPPIFELAGYQDGNTPSQLPTESI